MVERSERTEEGTSSASSMLIMQPEIVWDPKSRKNLYASCFLFSMCGFVLYLIIYYSKYFKGNFYLNYSISGLGDCVSLFYVDSLE